MDQSHEPLAIESSTPSVSVAPEVPTKQGTGFRRRHAAMLIGGACVLALSFGAGGIALGSVISAGRVIASSTTTTTLPQTGTSNGSGTTTDGGTGTTDGGTGTTDGGTGGYQQTSPFGGSDSGTGGSSSGSTGTSQSSATAATDAQKVGVVTIVSELNYSSSSEAAGTGVILTSGGKILTNNHVIEGATSIKVTVETTGMTYTAKVVGTDSTDDIAVLQLVDASGLQVATTDTASSVAVNDTATSIGNAEGTGNLVAAAGTVTAINQNISVGSEYSDATENLSGLIEVNADVVSGDSGGPLVDSDGEVIGIVTAASSGTSDVTGYAIPITTALSIVSQIESGVETSTVQIGLPAFLGVELATTGTTTTTSGVAISGVIDGTAAATAGLASGDTITAVDGTSVATSTALSSAISAHDPGDTVKITYTTAAGASKTVTVTLTEGPAA